MAIASKISKAARRAAEPTAAQAKAGNYRMGHVRIHGLDITIETPRGRSRRPEWPPLAAHYGYLKRTAGADGDHLDVFVGPHPDSELVFIVDQTTEGGKFDEHKCLLGFRSRMAAVDAYRSCYSPGWRVGPVTTLTIDQFKAWLRHGSQRRPARDQVSRYSATAWDESKHSRASDGRFGNKSGNHAAPASGASDQKWRSFSTPEMGNRMPLEVEIAIDESNPDRSRMLVNGSQVFVPTVSAEQIHADLTGDLTYLQSHGKSKSADVNTVIEGRASLIGKGDDGVVFDAGNGKIVKASTVVPYQPGNAFYLTPEQAVDRMRRQVQTEKEMRAAGIPGVMDVKAGQHGDKFFAIREKLTIPEKLTQQQLDTVQKQIEAMHAAGYTVNDQIQVGIGSDGQPYHFDLGKAKKHDDPEELEWYRKTDNDNLRMLYSQHGGKYHDPPDVAKSKALNAKSMIERVLASGRKKPPGGMVQQFHNALASLSASGTEDQLAWELSEWATDNSIDPYSATPDSKAMTLDTFAVSFADAVCEQYAARKAKNSPGQLGLFGDGMGGHAPLRSEKRQQSLNWDESKHPRATDGRFGTVAGDHTHPGDSAAAGSSEQPKTAAAAADKPGQSQKKTPERMVLGKRAGDAKVLGAMLYDQLQQKKPVSLLGQTARTAEDMAQLAQVYRDPRFETLRAFFIKDGVIIGQNAYSSRHPAAVALPENMLDQLDKDLKSLDADGFYLLHNHPSGAPDPSPEDISVTKRIEQVMPGKLLDHVIIDHTEGSIISGSGKVRYYKADNENLQDMSKATVPHEYLGKKILSTIALGQMAMGLRPENGRSVMIFTNVKGAVQMLLDINPDVMTGERGYKVIAAIRRASRATNSDRRFLVLPEGSNPKDYEHLTRIGAVTDIAAGSGKTAREAGAVDNGDPIQRRIKGREIARERFAAFDQEAFVDRLMATLHGITPEQYAARKAKNSPGQMGLFGDAFGGHLLRSPHRQQSLNWDESKHPRATDGRFGTTAGVHTGGQPAAPKAPKPKKPFVYPNGETQTFGGNDKPAAPAPQPPAAPKPPEQPGKPPEQPGKPPEQPPKSPEQPKPEAPKPKPAEPPKGDLFGGDDATPRDRAKRHTEETDPDYEFARKSAVPNAGEDLKGAARHKVNAWRSLEDAEKDGSAEKMVTRDQLLKNEPHTMAAHAHRQPVTVLAMHLAMKAFPPKPGAGVRYYKPDAEKAKKDRAQFVEVYRKIKAAAENEAKGSDNAIESLKKLNGIVKDEIGRLREGDRYNAMANSLVDLHKKLSQSWKKTSIPHQLTEFAVLEKEHHADMSPSDRLEAMADKVMHVLEGNTIASAFGKKSDKKSTFDAASAYVAHASRSGGPEMPASTAKAATQYLVEKAGFRGVQFGNSVSDPEREHHATMAAAAILDLADITGLPIDAIGLGGKLGLAIGARGRANALAHYEPGTKVINLTRKKGVGSLAHEWAHALDHEMAGGESPMMTRGMKEDVRYHSEDGGVTYTGKQVGGKWVSSKEDRTGQPLFKAMAGLQDAMKSSGFKDRLHDAMRDQGIPFSKSKYWTSGREMFARCFERYAQRKLESAGRKNTYLAGIETKAYKSGGLWPTDAEVDHMAPHFEKLLDTWRKEKHGLEKPVKYSASERQTYIDRLTATMLGMTPEQYAAKKVKSSPGQQEFDWITVHPHGKGEKGVPVMVNKKDGTIAAGMGGKFNGQKISSIGKGDDKPKASGGDDEDRHSNDVAAVPRVSNDEFADGDWDRAHAGLASETVQAKIAVGMKGIEGREYGIRQHAPGKWQLVSRPGKKADGKPKGGDLTEALKNRGKRPDEGSWDADVRNRYGESRGKHLEKHLGGGQWKTAGQMQGGAYKDDRSGSIARDLKDLVKSGAAQIAWDASGMPHYAKAGEPVPRHLATQNEIDASGGEFPGDKKRHSAIVSGMRSVKDHASLRDPILQAIGDGPQSIHAIGKAVGQKAGSGSDPLASPLNRALKDMVADGTLEVDDSDRGAPMFRKAAGKGEPPADSHRDEALARGLERVKRTPHLSTAAQAEQQALNAWATLSDRQRSAFSGPKQFASAVGKAWAAKRDKPDSPTGQQAGQNRTAKPDSQPSPRKADWSAVPHEGVSAFDQKALKPLRDHLAKLDGLRDNPMAGQRYAWEFATKNGTKPGDPYGTEAFIDRWAKDASRRGFDGEALVANHPELKELQQRIDAHRGWGSEDWREPDKAGSKPGIEEAPAPKNSEAKPGDQLGLLGEATRAPRKKAEFGGQKAKQANLIDGLNAKRGQMSLIDEAGAPDDMVYRKSDKFSTSFADAVVDRYRAGGQTTGQAAKSKESKPPRTVTGSFGDRGRFVTIEGHPVFIKDDGEIGNGPKHLKGRNAKEFKDVTERKRGPRTKRPDKFTPRTRQDHAIVETIGDHPDDVAAFRGHVEDAHKFLTHQTTEINDAMRNLLTQFGYNGRAASGFLSSLQRQRDTAKIRNWDQMAEYAAAHHPELLAGSTGESSGKGDIEHALFTRLRQGFEPPPSRHDPEVMELALKMAGPSFMDDGGPEIDPAGDDGYIGGKVLANPDDPFSDYVPFAAQVADHVIERYRLAFA